MMLWLRWAAGLVLFMLVFVMLGPFQGAEAAAGLTDKQAHAIGFFVITICLSLIAPRWEPTSTAMAAFSLGLAVEVAQGMTGRSASLGDLAADAVGVAVATLATLLARWAARRRRRHRRRQRRGAGQSVNRR